MTTTIFETTVWPFESNMLTPNQRVRMQEFRDDIERARANHAAGFSYHIWIDGRLHDSAVSHMDAFDECRAQRKAGCQDHMLIGSGWTDRTVTVASDQRDMVRVELPA